VLLKELNSLGLWRHSMQALQIQARISFHFAIPCRRDTPRLDEWNPLDFIAFVTISAKTVVGEHGPESD
jgi:hypothetical protein